MTEKQKNELLKKEEESKKNEEDFDPRKHRLTHGIRNYKLDGLKFEGQGIKMKWYNSKDNYEVIIILFLVIFTFE